jgi:hypothetical protein
MHLQQPNLKVIEDGLPNRLLSKAVSKGSKLARLRIRAATREFRKSCSFCFCHGIPTALGSNACRTTSDIASVEAMYLAPGTESKF